MYQIGDKVVIKRNGRFGYITDYTMGDNKFYFVYRPSEHGGSWCHPNEIKPYRLSNEHAWQYIQENVIDEYSFEDCFKSDEREHIKDLMIEAFNAGISYRKNSK